MTTRRYFALCRALMLILALLPWLASGQTIKTHASRDASVDYERLGRMDALINSFVQSNWVAGVVTIVVKDNQLIQYKGYGFADIESHKPMRSNNIFRIMSQTKAIVTVGLMTLYEEGKFTLDEPISDFIPEFQHPKVLDTYNETAHTYTTTPAKREITLRDLLTHTSGLDYPGIGSEKMKAIYADADIPSGLGNYNASLLEKVRVLGKLPLAHQPGEKWTYGLNSDVAGCLIEVISGTNLEDFLRQRIFQPLGMKDTWFNLPADKADRLASVYTEDDAHKIIRWGKTFRNIDPDYPLIKKTFFSGGAGLSSTAFDYAVFLQMLLNGGVYDGHRILAPRTIELMVQNQIGNLSLGKNKFGLGFEIVTAEGAAEGSRNQGTFSWGGYYGTTYWADPKAHLVCLIMTQQTPNSHSDLMKRLENIIYSSLK